MKILNVFKRTTFFKSQLKRFSASQAPVVNSAGNVQPWVEKENNLAKLKGELVLTEHDQIEKYVLGVFKGYFRTTYREGLSLESNIEDHGLDSLDAIEISMILEDELGYIIEAETMPKFTKVKHFVNFIKHLEAYKKENYLLPQLRAHEAEETWDNWIPKGEKIRAKLRSFVKKEKKEAPKTEEKH